jgi:hypothetical protein
LKSANFFFGFFTSFALCIKEIFSKMPMGNSIRIPSPYMSLPIFSSICDQTITFRDQQDCGKTKWKPKFWKIKWKFVPSPFPSSPLFVVPPDLTVTSHNKRNKMLKFQNKQSNLNCSLLSWGCSWRSVLWSPDLRSRSKHRSRNLSRSQFRIL